MVRCNVGGVDRGVRLFIAVLLILSAFFVTTSSEWAITLFAFAILPLVAGITGFCPVNSLLGLNTCEYRAESD